MTLADYLANHRETRMAFAARVGVASSTISRLCRGETAPEASLVAAIVRATGGEVLPNDLFPAAMAQISLAVAQPNEPA
ncbi:helix-turn-helix domain-containing protein [Roseococcus pinisoli]|uniref:Helix-turn-helix domain-containing protein n=1 Tax=Roseococcus pinisoli TaxID=2835040 RepID=A0ABS5QC28_9PROT|nr:helix-turn-helix domain-containing protein [Roseococcus pinisoli]MBS7810515.1 helix-turn-helix domain-containing protein [Roseococcus pinisoli]